MNKTIAKHTLLFSGFVFLAQVLGLVRDLYLARIFGVGTMLDTYYLAFKIPDFLNIFYSVFLGSVIFIPLLTNAKNKDGQTDNRKEIIKVIKVVGSLVLVLLLVFAFIVFIFMPYFANLLAPSWSLEQRQLLTSLSRTLLFAQFFFPVGILAGCIGMIYKKPLGMAVSGFAYNFFILLGAFLLIPIYDIYGLSYSVVVGSIFFMLIQLYPKEVREILFKFRFEFNFSESSKFVLKNIGRFFAVIAYQIYGLIILVLAGLAGPGGVTSFSIAYNIYLAVFFIIGASFSTALMPKIAQLHVSNDKVEQKKSLRMSLLVTFFVSAVAGVFLFFLSQFIVETLYHFSKLSVDDEIYIATLLSLLSISFPFFNLLEVVRKYLYSTSQILLAGSITTFLLFSVVFFTYIINIFVNGNTLNALIYSMNLSLFLGTIFILTILKYKKQI